MCSKLSFLLPLLFLTFFKPAQATELRVLQFNIWQEGTVVKGGFDAIVEEILANKADIVTFSEVRNYKNTKFNERIVDALRQRGQTYYSEFSYDSGILSRFPIETFSAVMPENSDHGSVFKAVVKVRSLKIAVYTAHMDYLNASNYPPRGYDANTWKKLDKRSSSIDELLEINKRSNRDETVDLIIEDGKAERSKGNIVVIGGDFNEPSHLDWAKNTRNLFDHNGLVIRWPNTIALAKSGGACTVICKAISDTMQISVDAIHPEEDS
ncbi:MAG: hypothetical protein EOP48_29430 [Sphingobacteriales bacterium]|nr:MAG: hypothetical protein EOP48_29430 [Sphingobacteriales bacterium]